MTDLLKEFYRNLDAVCNKKTKEQQKQIENGYINLLKTICENKEQARA
jgi:predicted KAP-like P-loop ATPase